MARQAKGQATEIELLRGRELVSTLTGAFGQALKETRLTAMLAYVIAMKPEPFAELFGFKGTPQRVAIETRHADGRSDILIETNLGIGVVEAKIDASDPLEQSYRYPARWVALLTHRIPSTASTARVQYVTWDRLAETMDGAKRTGHPLLRHLLNDLLSYLRAHRMTRDRQTVELYAREINEPVTLALFLHGQLYGCDYSPGSRLAEALYFAPHFAARIARTHPGVSVGISYIARIEAVEYAATWGEFRDSVYKVRGKAWWNGKKEILDDLHRKWSWKNQHRSFLFLGPPRLIFNPPVRKEGLQKGRGWLSKRFLTFDELLAAWGK